MPYVEDENGDHLLDDQGNKIEYTISDEVSDLVYIHRESLHIDDNNHVNTENRNIVIKDGVDANHAVSKGQLDHANTTIRSEITALIQTSIQTAVNNLKSQITGLIQTSIKTQEAKIITQMLNFRNEQIKNRIQRKLLTIPKTINTWIKLFDYRDVGNGVVNLNEVIILNVWIRRWDRYHNGKSVLLEKDFNNSIEFFYNADMTGYYTYFRTVPSNWDMSCIVEWLRIPEPISIESENIPSKPESNE